ncbi:neurexin-1 [Trichonephila clavipes]|nr:neurexin-1 [Trichonephila clavipes]
MSSSREPLKTRRVGKRCTLNLLRAQKSFRWCGVVVRRMGVSSETGSVENKPRPGGPSKLTSRAKRMIVRSATNKPMTSAQNFTNELLSSCNVSVSAQTVRNVLHSAGLKARTPRKKPYISEVNRKRRLEFVMKYKNKPMEFGKKVDGNIFMVYNMGTEDHPIGELSVNVNDHQYHVIRFTRSGPNSTIQIDDHNVRTKQPTEMPARTITLKCRYSMNYQGY